MALHVHSAHSVSTECLHNTQRITPPSEYIRGTFTELSGCMKRGGDRSQQWKTKEKAFAGSIQSVPSSVPSLHVPRMPLPTHRPEPPWLPEGARWWEGIGFTSFSASVSYLHPGVLMPIHIDTLGFCGTDLTWLLARLLSLKHQRSEKTFSSLCSSSTLPSPPSPAFLHSPSYSSPTTPSFFPFSPSSLLLFFLLPFLFLIFLPSPSSFPISFFILLPPPFFFLILLPLSSFLLPPSYSFLIYSSSFLLLSPLLTFPPPPPLLVLG